MVDATAMGIACVKARTTKDIDFISRFFVGDGSLVLGRDLNFDYEFVEEGRVLMLVGKNAVYTTEDMNRELQEHKADITGKFTPPVDLAFCNMRAVEKTGKDLKTEMQKKDDERVSKKAIESADKMDREEIDGEVVTEGGKQLALELKSNDRVMITEGFCSNSKNTDKKDAGVLKVGEYGIVTEVDEEGDARIKFDNNANAQWVFRGNFDKLEKVPYADSCSEDDDVDEKLSYYMKGKKWVVPEDAAAKDDCRRDDAKVVAGGTPEQLANERKAARLETLRTRPIMKYMVGEENKGGQKGRSGGTWKVYIEEPEVIHCDESLITVTFTRESYSVRADTGNEPLLLGPINIINELDLKACSWKLSPGKRLTLTFVPLIGEDNSKARLAEMSRVRKEKDEESANQKRMIMGVVFMLMAAITMYLALGRTS